MKRAAKLLFLLIAFMGVHAALRHLLMKIIGDYEMSLPHCCMSFPIWLIWAMKASDFFIYFPTFSNIIFSDLLWGCIGLVIYLWIEKRRNSRRGYSQARREAQEGILPPSSKPAKPV